MKKNREAVNNAAERLIAPSSRDSRSIISLLISALLASLYITRLFTDALRILCMRIRQHSTELSPPTTSGSSTYETRRAKRARFLSITSRKI